MLLVIALICFLAATGMGGQDYTQQGAYCIAAFFVLAALPFLITALRKRRASRRETAAAIQAQQHTPGQPQQQERPYTPPQSRSRGGVFLPQTLPEQGKNKPRQEGR